MRARVLFVLLVVALLVQATAGGGVGGAAAYGAGSDFFSFRDARIGESSGVVASSVRDGVFFTHNDSGDKARFFAVDEQGCTLATYDLAGFDEAAFRATADVEDLARGGGSLWLGDIGDNLHQRSEIAVHRVEEPNVDSSVHRSSTGCRSTAEAATVVAETFRLAYPDHPHDAETLLYDEVGSQLLVVTKTPFGQSSVYAAALPLLPGVVNPLTLVGAIVFPPSTTYDRDPVAQVTAPSTQIGFDVAGRLMAVGGDVSPTGDRVVVRTYTDAWEWVVPAGAASVAEAFLGVPTQLPLRYQRQGEAIGYTRDGASLVTTCEDVGCTAHRY